MAPNFNDNDLIIITKFFFEPVFAKEDNPNPAKYNEVTIDDLRKFLLLILIFMLLKTPDD